MIASLVENLPRKSVRHFEIVVYRTNVDNTVYVMWKLDAAERCFLRSDRLSLNRILSKVSVPLENQNRFGVEENVTALARIKTICYTEISCSRHNVDMDSCCRMTRSLCWWLFTDVWVQPYVPSSRVNESKKSWTNIRSISRRAKGFGYYVEQLSDMAAIERRGFRCDYYSVFVMKT